MHWTIGQFVDRSGRLHHKRNLKFGLNTIKLIGLIKIADPV